jgi:hypothetical protein
VSVGSKITKQLSSSVGNILLVFAITSLAINLAESSVNDEVAVPASVIEYMNNKTKRMTLRIYINIKRCWYKQKNPEPFTVRVVVFESICNF